MLDSILNNKKINYLFCIYLILINRYASIIDILNIWKLKYISLLIWFSMYTTSRHLPLVAHLASSVLQSNSSKLQWLGFP